LDEDVMSLSYGLGGLTSIHCFSQAPSDSPTIQIGKSNLILMLREINALWDQKVPKNCFEGLNNQNFKYLYGLQIYLMQR
jgi:hypothetical protein